MTGSPTQAQFAVLCGISRNSVTRYESDAEGADKPIVIMRWADVTGFDYRWLQSGGAEFTGTSPDIERYPLALTA
jgi:transcriptional regulator with XRE-family HTH domain